MRPERPSTGKHDQASGAEDSVDAEDTDADQTSSHVLGLVGNQLYVLRTLKSSDYS
jgi:hypothetical protein